MPRDAKTAMLKVGPQGRVVIPVSMRRALGMEPGESVLASVADGRLVLEQREAILRRLQDEVRGSVPSGVSVVDELIDERREDARREAREHER